MNSKSKLVLMLLLSVGTPIQANMSTGQEMSVTGATGEAMAGAVALYAKQMGKSVCTEVPDPEAMLTCEGVALTLFAAATLVGGICDSFDRFHSATLALAQLMEDGSDIDVMDVSLKDMLKDVKKLAKLVAEKSPDLSQIDLIAKRMLIQGQNFLTYANEVVKKGEEVNNWGGNPFYHLYCAFRNCPWVPPEAEVALNAVKNNMVLTLPYIESVNKCSTRAAKGKEPCARSFMMDTVQTIKEKLLQMKDTLGRFVDDMKKANPTTLFGKQIDCNQLKMESKNLSSRLDARLNSCNLWARIYFWFAAVALAVMLFLRTKHLEALLSQQAPARPTTQKPERAREKQTHGSQEGYQPLPDNERDIPKAPQRAPARPTTQKPDSGNGAQPNTAALRDTEAAQPESEHEKQTRCSQEGYQAPPPPEAACPPPEAARPQTGYQSLSDTVCGFFLAIVLLVCCSLWRTKVTQAAFLEIELDTINKIPSFTLSDGCQSDEHLKLLMQAVMAQAKFSLL